MKLCSSDNHYTTRLGPLGEEGIVDENYINFSGVHKKLGIYLIRRSSPD